MIQSSKKLWITPILILAILVFSFQSLTSQGSTTFSTGSYIINMGVVPQTSANGLKPYGLIQKLMRKNVPVSWIISPTKAKDSADFIYNSVKYRGGTFIIPAEFRNTTINSLITSFGVTGTTTTSPLTVDVTYELTSGSSWTLNDENQNISKVFFTGAGLAVTDSLYNTEKPPSALGGCDDVFVAPHSDPTWATHSNLYNWVRDSNGSIWAGCHSVSVMEALNNGSSTTPQQMNFLSNNVGATLGNSLINFGSHNDATPPFNTYFPNDPVQQYMGLTDDAQSGGSESVYLPVPGGSWRTGTKLLVVDPTQSDVTGGSSPGPAVIAAYGRAFSNPNHGWVMYQANHNVTGNNPENIAAMRQFWNFSLLAMVDKVPIIDSIVIPTLYTSGLTTQLGFYATSKQGSTLTYTWQSSCGGSFSNAAIPNPVFTAPVVSATTQCIITCEVKDKCKRIKFRNIIANIVPSADLKITKTVSPVNAKVGSNVTFTLTAINNGPSPAAVNVKVTDSLPAGFTFVSATPSKGVWSAPNWTIDTLKNTASATLQIVATVNPAGPYKNVGVIECKPSDPNCGDNRDSATPKVVYPVFEVGTVTSALGGVAITNIATNDKINDVPATIGTGGNATIATSGTWPTGISLNTSTGAISVVPGTANGKYQVTYTLCDKVSPIGCQDMVDTIYVTPNADLKVTKTVSPTNARVGSNVTFTITATNLGPSNQAGITLNDALPAGFTYVSHTASQGTWSAPTWTIGTLNNGANATLTMVATVNPTGPYKNVAILDCPSTDTSCTNNRDSSTPKVIYPVTESGTVSAAYGGVAITNIVTNDKINLIPATLGAGGNATIATSGTWPTGISLNTSTGAISVVPGTTDGTYLVTYTLCDKVSPIGCQDMVDTVFVTPNSDLKVTKTVNPSNARVGNNVTFTITATNLGPSNRAGITLNDVLAAGFTYVSHTASQGTWSAPTWTIGTLNNGANATLTMVATVNATGPYKNVAILDCPSTDTSCKNNRDSSTPKVIHPVTESGTVSAAYGGVAITNIVTNDKINLIPATLGAGGNATIATSGTWPTGISLNTSTGAISVVPGTADGKYLVTYTLCDKVDTIGCQDMVDTVYVTPNADLKVTKTVSPTNARVGSNVTFTITATNLGPSNQAGITLNDVLAAGFTYVSHTASQGTWSAPTWTIGTLNNGANATLTMVATVNPTGPYKNVAILDCPSTDTSCKNNRDSSTPKVVHPVTESGTVSSETGGTAIANIVSNDKINTIAATLGAGGNATIAISGTWPTGITLDVSTGEINVAAAKAPGHYPVTYTLCDKVAPIGCQDMEDTIHVTPSINPVAEGGTVTAAYGGVAISNVVTNDKTNGVASTLGAGGNSTIATSGVWPTGISLNTSTGAISVVPGTTDGVYYVSYTLSDKLTPVSSKTVVDTVTVTPNSDLAITKTVSPMNAKVGSNVTFTLTATNRGPSTQTGITATDALPAGFTFVSANPSQGTWADPTWTIGTLASGTSVTLQIVATVNPVGPYKNVAVIVCPSTDTSCKNNRDSSTPKVVMPVTENGTVTSELGGVAIANIAANDKINTIAATLGAGGNATISTSGVWPAGISLNVNTGEVTVVPSKVPGHYPVTYTLCDKVAPIGCQDMVDTIHVTPSILPVTESGTVSSVTGGVAMTNIASNDRVNGFAAILGAFGNSTVAPMGVWPTGITLNAAGVVSVAPGTPAAVYPVTYELCDLLTPMNCAPMVDFVTVTPGTDVSITKTVNVPQAKVGNDVIFTITVKNNGPIVALGIDVSEVLPAAYTLVNHTESIGSWDGSIWTIGDMAGGATETMTITANVGPNGPYKNIVVVNCIPTDPDCTNNRDSAEPKVIYPITESGTVGTVNGGIALANIVSNDKIYGLPAVLGLGGNASVSKVGLWPVGISLDIATGKVSVAPGTTPGHYGIVYQLCDILPVIACETMLDSVHVTPLIKPVTNTGTVYSGPGGTPILNVASNDTVNGKPATVGTTGNSTVVVVNKPGVSTWPTGITLDPTTGRVVVAPGTPAGNYELYYLLSDKNVPPNSKEQVITVIVLNPKPDTITIPFENYDTIYNICTTKDDLFVFTSGFDYSSCGAPEGYVRTGPDVYGCYNYRADKFTISNKPIMTCQIACVGGVCDTTYVKCIPPLDGDIPNYFSPNGDGVNDQWILPGWVCRNNACPKIIIYNRFGSIIWRSIGEYKNDWEGTYFGTDDPVPEGIYFYIIEFGGNFAKTKSGFVEIMRTDPR